MWIFGYGSLIWKVDFPYEQKIVGYVRGFSRRFYQHSTDHRGTSEKPGRVVTLIPSHSEDKVYGIAYKIKEDDVDHVIKHLDYREKGGYKREEIIFYPRDNGIDSFDIVIYLATDDNPQYAGHADIDSIAEQVVSSVGPSGTNIEYVCNLAATMRDIAPDIHDEHLFHLEERILKKLQNSSNNSNYSNTSNNNQRY